MRRPDQPAGRAFPSIDRTRTGLRPYTEGLEMKSLFVETHRQYLGIRRLLDALVATRTLLTLGVSGLLTIVLWNTGLFAVFLDALPTWAELPVMMPLFGSMLAVYALGGIATASLMLSAVYDVAMMPVRRFLPQSVEGV